MTGYHISIGYLSGDDNDKAWAMLKRIVADLCAKPEVIAEEAMAFGMRPETAKEYAESYRSFSLETGRTEDSTLVVKERDLDDEDSYVQIMQLASGRGVSRTNKEAMRRAVCRILMREMHKRGLEININVA